MSRRETYFSLDVEASGPIPGPWWMCSFGVCRTDDVSRGFTRSLRPLVVEGLARPDVPGAMKVVARGVPGLRWDHLATDRENVARVRAHFEREGEDPRQALEALRDWLAAEAGESRPVIVGAPVTFDFMWLYWYWWHLLEEMPPFGFSGLDVRSYFMGAHGSGFRDTHKRRYLQHYPNDLPHTHDPLDDARQQGRIWQDMLDANREDRRG